MGPIVQGGSSSSSSSSNKKNRYDQYGGQGGPGPYTYGTPEKDHSCLKKCCLACGAVACCCCVADCLTWYVIFLTWYVKSLFKIILDLTSFNFIEKKQKCL